LIHFLRITVLKPKIATRFLHQSFRQNVLWRVGYPRKFHAKHTPLQNTEKTCFRSKSGIIFRKDFHLDFLEGLQTAFLKTKLRRDFYTKLGAIMCFDEWLYHKTFRAKRTPLIRKRCFTRVTVIGFPVGNYTWNYAWNTISGKRVPLNRSEILTPNFGA
jgi:hypothetical protein